MSSFEIIRITVVEIRPLILKALCKCRWDPADWIVKSDRVVCSYCGREIYGDFYTVIKAPCPCSWYPTDWFIGHTRAACSRCGRSVSGKVVAIAKRAALCKCSWYLTDWFIMDDETWICTSCGRKR